MKKIGFTLAEVLITLGIIGVVAALTAPALVMSSRNQANGARLSTCISNLENAFTSAIAQEGASDIFGTTIWQALPDGGLDNTGGEANINRFVGALKQYIRLSGYKSGDFYDVGPFPITSSGASGEEDDSLVEEYVPINMSNGATMFIIATREGINLGGTREQIMNRGGSLFEVAAYILIDVNGKSAPNTVGRDLFGFALGSDGILYPIGGIDAAIALQQDTWEDNGDFSCLPAANNQRNVGWGCTARLIENGFQMDY